jgi:hypothetical protein
VASRRILAIASGCSSELMMLPWERFQRHTTKGFWILGFGVAFSGSGTRKHSTRSIVLLVFVFCFSLFLFFCFFLSFSGAVWVSTSCLFACVHFSFVDSWSCSIDAVVFPLELYFCGLAMIDTALRVAKTPLD